MGVGRCGNIVYVTGLGLATGCSHTQLDHGASLAWKPKLRLLDTMRFASIISHLEKVCISSALMNQMLIFVQSSLARMI